MSQEKSPTYGEVVANFSATDYIAIPTLAVAFGGFMAAQGMHNESYEVIMKAWYRKIPWPNNRLLEQVLSIRLVLIFAARVRHVVCDVGRCMCPALCTSVF